MNRILTGIMIGIVVLGTAAAGSAQELDKQDTTIPEAYYTVAKEIMEEHGEQGSQVSTGNWYATGLSGVAFLDFNGDGAEDMLTVYYTGSTESIENEAMMEMPQYKLQIWSANEDGAELLYETDQLGDARNSYGVLYGKFVNIIGREQGGDVLQFTAFEQGNQKNLIYYNTFMDGGNIVTDRYSCSSGGFLKNDEIIDGYAWIDEVLGNEPVDFLKLAEFGNHWDDVDSENNNDSGLLTIDSLEEGLLREKTEVPLLDNTMTNFYRRLLLILDIYENHSALYNIYAHQNYINEDYSDTEVGRILKETLSSFDEAMYSDFIDYQSLQYIDYAIYDINKDGFPELMINNHIRHFDVTCYVFSVKDGNLIYCGNTNVYRGTLYGSETAPGLLKEFPYDQESVDNEVFNVDNSQIAEYLVPDNSGYDLPVTADYPKNLGQLVCSK